MRTELAIYLPGALITPPENPYGRLIANAGTYRSLAAHPAIEHVHFQCRTPPAREDLAAQVGLPPERVSVTTPLQTAAAVSGGLLFSGQPYLTEPAWVRRHARSDNDYSIVGSIFAFSSPRHREQMLQSTLAPMHDWDALICSSPSLRATVESTLDDWQEYLVERLGATRVPRMQLPVIPFGCDVAKVAEQSRDAQARASLRNRLGLGEDDVLVYFLGRLSFYDKAFPQPMLKAVAQAARRTGVTTQFVMTGWFPSDDDRQRYTRAAAEHAPGVRTTFLDGNDAGTVAQCWAAADVFLLLSDTIIETFGQALVEAMAAGLPLVVSDWDGYRFIVRDEQDGLLIPTLGAPAGPLGRTLALLDGLEMLNYPAYSGTVAEHTAVNVGAAADALARLLESAPLRRRLGDNARRQAFDRFAWPVVAGQYMELFAELDARRESGEPAAGARMNPLRDDPFATFRELPSRVLDDQTLLHATGAQPSYAQFDCVFPAVRASQDETQELLDGLREGPRTLGDLLCGFPAHRRPFLRMTAMWLAKAGVVDWL